MILNEFAILMPHEKFDFNKWTLYKTLVVSLMNSAKSENFILHRGEAELRTTCDTNMKALKIKREKIKKSFGH